MLSPCTAMLAAVSPCSAGPWITEPSTAENNEPWQGQTISFSATSPTKQPWCGQIAVNALKVPSLGCVMTIGGSGGGKVIATGTPEAVAATVGSFTGDFLRERLKLPPPKLKRSKAS